jgi:PTS system nitrogen regulatory IIA component
MQLDLRDAARCLGVDESTLHRWIRRGELAARRVHDRWEVDRVDLLEFAARRGMPVGPELLADPEGDAAPQPTLHDALLRGGVHHGVPGEDRATVLRAVVDRLALPGGVDRSFVHAMLLAREGLGSTGVGHGIAIPHPRHPIVLRVEEASVAVCYLAQPVDFAALDGEPVHTLFTVVSPSVRVHLHLLALLAAALHDPGVAAALARRADAADLLPELERVEAAIAARGRPREDRA